MRKTLIENLLGIIALIFLITDLSKFYLRKFLFKFYLIPLKRIQTHFLYYILNIFVFLGFSGKYY